MVAATQGRVRWYPAHDNPFDRKRALWTVEGEPHVLIRVKRLFGRVEDTRGGGVVIADTDEVARDLEWLLERYDFELDGEAVARVAAGAERHRGREETMRRLLGGHRLDVDGGLVPDPARERREYQYAAADMVIALGRLLLVDALGLGKTESALLVLRAPDSLPAVVVTLTHLPKQWEREIGKVYPGLRAHTVTRGKPYDLRGVCGGRNPQVVVVNYAKLAGWAGYLAEEARTVVFDEIQELRRGPGTESKPIAKYLAAGTLADAARYKVGLSATPIHNYGGEIHNIFEVLAPGTLGTRPEFVREWGSGDSSHFDKVTVKDPKALRTYLEGEGLMLVRSREDVGRELPHGVIPIEHVVDADPKAIDELGGDVAEMARLILADDTGHKDRFLVAGELDWRLRQATGLAKAPYVAEFVRLLLESEDRVVLWGWHRAVYDVWMEQLRGLHPVLYTGTESPAQKDVSARKFLSGQSRVLVMSLRSGAGLDGLQEACSVGVFGELDWSPEVHKQCLDDQTEILTRRGFVGPDDIADDDEVAAFSHDGQIRWRPILSRVDRLRAPGEQMYALSSPSLDLRVTGGHRMVHRVLDESWRLTEAARLAGRSQSWSIPVAGHEDAPGVPLTDAELTFLGWFVTDGCMATAARQVVICQAPTSPYLDEIAACLDACGFAWARSEQTRDTAYAAGSTMLRFSIPKHRSRTREGRGWAPLAAYLDKDLSPLLDAMDARQLGVFLAAVHAGDGNKQRGQSWTQRSYHIGTGNLTFAERLQSLCVRRGWRANVSTRPTPAGKPHYTLHTKPEPVRSVGGHGKANLVAVPAEPDERVWCVENDLRTLVVRRNGKVAVVGNCIGRLYRDGQTKRVLAYYLVSEEGSDPSVAEVLQVKRGQSEPMFGKGVRLLEVPDAKQRARMLAESYLARAAKRRR